MPKTDDRVGVWGGGALVHQGTVLYVDKEDGKAWAFNLDCRFGRAVLQASPYSYIQSRVVDEPVNCIPCVAIATRDPDAPRED